MADYIGKIPEDFDPLHNRDGYEEKTEYGWDFEFRENSDGFPSSCLTKELMRLFPR